MDLVEVAPKSQPPVCRVMDYGKWKYHQKKKDHDNRKRQHVRQTKEVRLRPNTDTHDQDIKMKKAREFLDKGDKVQFTMLFRGRERFHIDLGYETFQHIAGQLEEVAKLEVPPRMEGRRMTMLMAPGLAKKPAPDKQASSSDKDGSASAGDEPSPAETSPAANEAQSSPPAEDTQPRDASDSIDQQESAS